MGRQHNKHSVHAQHVVGRRWHEASAEAPTQGREHSRDSLPQGQSSLLPELGCDDDCEDGDDQSDSRRACHRPGGARARIRRMGCLRCHWSLHDAVVRVQDTSRVGTPYAISHTDGHRQRCCWILPDSSRALAVLQVLVVADGIVHLLLCAGAAFSLQLSDWNTRSTSTLLCYSTQEDEKSSYIKTNHDKK